MLGLYSCHEGGLSQTVTNVQKFTGALADNSDNVSKFLKQTGDAAESIGHLSDSLNGMTGVQARYTLELSHYEAVTPSIQLQLSSQYKIKDEE